MKKLFEQWGKHVIAILFFLSLVVVYFAPAVIDGKVIVQGDNIKATGMGHSQMEQYAKTAQPGEFSAWSDAMFGGMPYAAGYGNPEPSLPSYNIVDGWMKKVGYTDAAMIFTGLVSFYILMCVLGVNWWLALAGAVAFAFASYNIIVIEAGHIVKAYVIGYMPLTLAGMAVLFKKKYLWGAVLFTLGVAFSLANGHIQITYYLVLLCLAIYIGFMINKFRKKEYGVWLKTSLIMAACVLLAVLPNAKGMYSQWELGQHSLRGPSELTPKADASGKVEKASTGLDKDYAFQWSYGWKELLTTLVPNAYGGGSGGTLGADSNLVQELRKNGAQVGNEVQSYTYWGDKPFTSGPVYFGSLVCFLFVLGMFVIKNPMKWWIFGAGVFLTFLALGRNFDAFNDLMFHYLPLYNKFRTVEMALVIPGMVAPLIGIWGLNLILKQEVSPQQSKKGFFWALGITGGLSLVLWLMPSLLLSFESTYDAQFQGQVPDWYYRALIADRAAMASADALRSLVFILIGALLLLWFWKAKNKTTTATIVSIGMLVLILTDLWTVDKRYLGEKNFTNEKPAETYKESVADKTILADNSPGTYRVFNLNNPWQETNTSYYHHSVGGYHAVKLRRYQELIDHRLDPEYRSLMASLQKAQSPRDLYATLEGLPTLNMMNAKYIIYNPDQQPIVNPYAMGNVWFVDSVEVVPNADAEIAAMDRINPRTTAVVDKRFEDQLKGFTPQPDSTATITLEAYRPNRLTYKSDAATPQLAVFSEIYYDPGWQVTIDGKEVPHFRADWTLRGMIVPAGQHTIVFEFRPQAYVTAAYISAYSSLFILLLLIGALAWSAWKEFGKKG